VKAKSVRTIIDIPGDLHQRLKEAAAREGCSARQIILRGIEHEVQGPTPENARTILDLSKGLIPSRGRTITDEMIYDLLAEFP
jgi:hypothetical protein